MNFKRLARHHSGRRNFLSLALSLSGSAFLFPKKLQANVLYNLGSFWRSATGTLWACGDNGYGELGLGYEAPGSAVSLLNQVGGYWTQAAMTYAMNTSTSVGMLFSFGIDTHGRLWAWGDNSYGQLGLGNTTSYSSPVQVAGSWTQIAAGAIYAAPFALAINTKGQLFAWGSNANGNGNSLLGNGSATTMWSSPVQIGTKSWTQVSAGRDFWGGIQTDHTLWGCGENSLGEIGQGNTTDVTTPTKITGSWTQVSCGGDPATANGGTMVAIKSNGTLWAWGSNLYGQMGVGGASFYSSPVQIGTKSWTQVSASGWAHTMAIRSDATMWVFGRNDVGQLGVNGTVGTICSSPIQVGGSWTQVWGGFASSFGIKTDGSLWAWGYNNANNLGTGDGVSYSSPVQISVGPWASVSSNLATLAIRKT